MTTKPKQLCDHCHKDMCKLYADYTQHCERCAHHVWKFSRWQRLWLWIQRNVFRRDV